MNEPQTYFDLWMWLDEVAIAGNSLALPLPPESSLWRSAGDAELWLVGVETEHIQAIQEAATRTWMHGEDIFQGLPIPVAQLLRLRIAVARDWIEELATKDAIPIPYPSEDFRDVLEWLLIAWWDRSGHRHACVSMLLRALIEER